MPVQGFDRRTFLTLASAFGATAALAACAGPSTSGAGGTATAATTDFSGVTPAPEITWWSSNPGGSQAVSQQIIDAFHASQSDIRVTLVTAGANYEEIAQRFQTAQTGGELPDVILLSDVWWFRYFMQGSITPLGPLIEAVEIDTADYRPSLISDYQYDGQQWALPWARSTPLFYYNKAHFAAAGLPDRAPESWDEFAEWGPRLAGAGTGAQIPFQLPDVAGYAGWTFQNNLWGRGGAWSNEWDITTDSAESIGALQFLQDAVYTGGWAGVASNESTDDLAAGAASATIGSTGSLVGVLDAAQFDVGVGFLPAGPVGGPVCPTGGSGLGITSGVTPERQLAAAHFIKFLTNPENTVTFAGATGYMPVRTSADISPLVAAAPQAAVAVEQLAVTRSQDWARVFLPGADQEMARACANILTSQADVQTEMATLKTALEGIYTNDVQPNL